MHFDISELLGGVGLLVFGMYLLEQSLYLLAGHQIKQLIQSYTKSVWLAVIIGRFATLIMSGSGDLVTLLAMAFFSSGLITFRSSLGIIFGSNIGATSLPLIVSFFGFGKLDFMHLVLPLIAISGVMIMLRKGEHIGKAIMGFCLLFVAIEWMGTSISGLESSFDISQYKDVSLWGFGLLGAILAAIIQSGGAIGVITLTALQQGIITFPASIAIMMGVNIGTTNTPFLAAFGGKREKVQVAVSHVLFNVISGIIGVVFFWQYIWLGQVGFGFADNVLLSSAVINFIFNASTAILFACFVGQFERLVNKLVPNKNSSHLLEVENLGNEKLNIKYTIPFTIALQHDTKNLVTEVVDIMERWVDERMLRLIVNKKAKDHAYVRTSSDDAITKSKKLLGMAIEFQRVAKNTQTITSIDQCKLTIRQCYHALELINRTDAALENKSVHIPSGKEQFTKVFAAQIQEIIEMMKSVRTTPPSPKNIIDVLQKIKEMRLGVLQLLTQNVNNNEGNDDNVSSMIIFTQRLYQICKKLVKAIDYMYLSDEESRALLHELE